MIYLQNQNSFFELPTIFKSSRASNTNELHSLKNFWNCGTYCFDETRNNKIQNVMKQMAIRRRVPNRAVISANQQFSEDPSARRARISGALTGQLRPTTLKLQLFRSVRTFSIPFQPLQATLALLASLFRFGRFQGPQRKLAR